MCTGLKGSAEISGLQLLAPLDLPKSNNKLEILLVKICNLKQKTNEKQPANIEKIKFYLFKNTASCSFRPQLLVSCKRWIKQPHTQIDKVLQWGNVKQKPFKANVICSINLKNSRKHTVSAIQSCYYDIGVLQIRKILGKYLQSSPFFTKMQATSTLFCIFIFSFLVHLFLRTTPNGGWI